ncbi:MAG TPA: CGNR zinc finger domain-containing protein [Actinopolymorphaceae bacterium]
MADEGHPRHVVLLRDFANTVDVESGTEALPNAPDLTRWLRHYGLMPDRPEVAATDDDLRRAHALRAGLRRAMGDHHDGAVADRRDLTELAAVLPLRVAFGPAGPRLEPALDGVSGALARLLAAVMTAQADGTWQRLKLCRSGDCAWAFFDSSKNRSRTWCSMGICGNRNKTRAYRARRRREGSTP